MERNLTNLYLSESFYRLLQTDPVDDSTLLDGTGSLVTYLAVSGTVDAYSFKGDGSQLTNISNAALSGGIVSSSTQTIQHLIGTDIISGSGQRSILGLATTDSPTFNNLVLTGDLTARQLIVSSSVISVTQSFSSGSNIFGNSLDDTHQFTGSLFLSGLLKTPNTISASAFSGIFEGAISSSAQISALGFVTSGEISDSVYWNNILSKPTGLVSSSIQTLTHLFGTNIISGSGQRSVLGLGEADSPRFATLYATNGNFDGNVVVGGTITARTYVVSSSVVNYQTLLVSGSSKFGDSTDDTHEFTGSLTISGSFVLPSTNELPIINSTGSLVISASNAYLFI